MDLDLLYSLIGSETRARILAGFVANPEARRGMDALARLTGVGRRALRAELARLVEEGVLLREREGRRVVYARTWIPAWRTYETLMSSYGIPLLLQSALAEVPGVEAAFIFGSLARGDARPDSDIDLLVYGDEIPPGAVSSTFGYVYGLLDRKLDDKILDRELFQELNGPRASFLPSALAGSKVWLVGSESDLARAAAA